MTITSISLEWRFGNNGTTWGHSYMVARTASDTQDEGQVISGNQSNVGGYPDYLQIDLGNPAGTTLAAITPGSFSGYVTTNAYGTFATIDGYGEYGIADTATTRHDDSDILTPAIEAKCPTLTLDQIWASFEAMANSIGAAQFSYVGPTVTQIATLNYASLNSNSLTATLLAAIGIDATTVMEGTTPPTIGWPGNKAILSTNYTDSVGDGINFDNEIGYGDAIFYNLGGGSHTFNGGNGTSGSLVPYNVGGENSSLVLLDVGTGGSLSVSLNSGHTAWLATETIGSTGYNDTCYSMKSINGVEYSTTAPSTNPAIDLGNEASATTFQDLSATAMAALAPQLGIATLTDAMQITSASGDISLEVGNFGSFTGTSGNDTFMLNQVIGRTFIGGGGNDVADYSGLSSGILVKTTSSGSTVQLANYTGTGSAPQDTLTGIDTITGTSGGDDVFVLPSGTGHVPLSINESGSGHDTYVVDMTGSPSYSGGVYVNADIYINDATDHGNVVLQANPGVQLTTIQFGYYASEASWMPAGEFPSGDKIMQIQVGNGTTGSDFAYLDMTTAAAGTGATNVEIGGINFSAQALATYELGLGTGFDPSGGPAGLYTDIYGTSPSNLLPGPIYDTTTGQITGMAAPSYASSGAGNFVGGSFATEIDHPWVITAYSGPLGGPGFVSISIQTYIDAAILNVAASDVRIVWGGPSSDSLTVYAVSEAQSFTIQDFTQGMTIHGIGFLGNEEYNALAEHLTGLSASSPGNYTGGFSDSTGVATGTGFDVTYWLENMFFSDGTGWNMQSGPLTFTSVTDGQNLYSRDGYNDTLVDLNNYDVLTGSTGNTTMVAGPDSALYQGTGTDTDVFSTGASPISGGGDAVELNTSGGTASIVLHGITPSAVTMWDTGAGEFLIQYSSTDVIRVYGGTDGSSGFTMGSLTGITFDDTTHWDLTAGLTLTATSDYQYIDGTTGGGDTLIALGTGDSLTAHAGTETLVAGHGAYLYNGTGNDTDVFSAGTAPISYGGDHVYEGSGSGTTAIAFHGIDPSAVTMWDDSYGHLTIQFSSTDQITVLGGSLDYTNGFTLGSLTEITFDDTGHTTWDLTGGLNLIATSDYQYLYGTTGGGDTLTATGTGDYLYAYAGAETLVAGPGAHLYNGTGNDIDVINSGSSPSSSSATIHANASGGTDNVIQIHDVVAADITMWDDTYGNLTVATPTDQFTVAGGSYSGTTGFAVGNIDHIALDDSSTIGLQGSLSLTAVNDSQTIYGTGHGDSMTAAGNYDFLYGIAGNNTMTGDSGTAYFYGGSGNDLMIGGSGTNNMTMGTGNDEIKLEGSSSTTNVNGFDATHDTIHLEDVMSGFDALTDALSNWVQKTDTGGSTVIAVDPTGTGSFTAGPQVTLNSVTGLDDIATLIAHGVVHV